MAVKNVWIITDQSESIGELCSGGRQLGEHVTAIILGDENNGEIAVRFGADQVYLLESPSESTIFEGYSKSIAKLIEDEKPELVLVHSSVTGKLLAGRIASRLETSVLSNAFEVKVEDSNIVISQMVYGGAAIRTEKALSEIAIVTVGSGVFKTLEADDGKEGQIEKLDLELDDSGITVLETRPKQGESINLNSAKYVVGVGRGFANEEDLKLAEDFAKAIGAELACTRPIAEGEKWMGKERYIGVSGVVIKPDLYVAIGVSGQIQHMVGVNQAKTIVAINKDKNAPIFKQVDIGLVGDLYKILPQLVEEIKS